MAGRKPSWTADMIERLERLKQRGCDYPMIAETLTVEFKPVTASAVSAKAWREGISCSFV